MLTEGGKETEEVLSSVFEHGLEVMGAVTASVSRKHQKKAREMSERLETALESVNDELTAQPL